MDVAEDIKLTKRVVDAAKTSASGPAFVWDRELRGFGLKVLGTGKKVFVLQYRNAEKRSRRIVLGVYGIITVEEARDEARVKLGEVAKGLDPAEMIEAQRNGITVAAICDWYLEEATAGRLLGRKRQPIKASTLYMDRSRVETHIKPLLGRRMVGALRLSDIEKMQSDIAEGRTAKGIGAGRGRVTTGGAGAAARSVTTLHSIFAHAARKEMIDSNPASGVRKLASKKRERRLSREEIAQLGDALRRAEREDEHPTGIAAIRLIALTGFRIMEALGVQRAWVSVEGCYVSFPDTKSGPQVRAIGARAAAFLAQQPVIKGCDYVFPSDSGKGHFIAADGVLGRICKRAGIEGVTAHTLRHTFASIAAELGFTELIISALLGHAAGTVTQRYIHVDEAVRLAVNRVSEEIATLLDGEACADGRADTFSFQPTSIWAGSPLTGTAGLITVRGRAPASGAFSMLQGSR